MAKNTGDDRRRGEVRGRSHFYNEETERWYKRDAETGQILEVKEDGKPFKGVRKER